MSRNLFAVSQTALGLAAVLITSSIAFADSLRLSSGSAAQACPCSEIKMPEKAPDGIGYDPGIKFSHSPEYKKEFNDAIQSAYTFCRKYLLEHKGEGKFAVVADIDETVLDNRERYKGRTDFAAINFDDWISQSSAPPLKASVDFLNWARKQGIAVFLITGRTERQRADTINNLVKDGIVYDGLYLRTNGDKSRAEEFKPKYRKDIEDMGFKILVSLGDQYSDLAGGYALDCEKLPNKMYYVK